MTAQLEGTLLPASDLLSTEGGTLSLPVGLEGAWTLLYFYPKDDTPGCTRQACGYRDHLGEFRDIGARVYGISLDGLNDHAAFREKYGLNFPLLVDTADGLCASLGAYREQEWQGKKYMGLSRDSFLVDPNGKIARVWRSVNPDSTISETLSEIKKRQG